MSYQSVNARRTIVVASVVVLLAIGAMGLAGCISSMVIPGIAAASLADELAYDLSQEIITSSGLYRLAIDRARESKEIKTALGNPLQVGAVSLSSEYTFDEPGYGHADFIIRVSGPRGTGDLHVVAELRGATVKNWIRSEIRGVVVTLPEYEGTAWEFDKLELTLDGSPMSIDLLRGAK